MLNWACTNTVLQFNEKYYTQVENRLTDCTFNGRRIYELVS